jgi:hypothetical protein
MSTVRHLDGYLFVVPAAQWDAVLDWLATNDIAFTGYMAFADIQAAIDAMIGSGDSGEALSPVADAVLDLEDVFVHIPDLAHATHFKLRWVG